MSVSRKNEELEGIRRCDGWLLVPEGCLFGSFPGAGFMGPRIGGHQGDAGQLQQPERSLGAVVHGYLVEQGGAGEHIGQEERASQHGGENVAQDFSQPDRQGQHQGETARGQRDHEESLYHAARGVPAVVQGHFPGLLRKQGLEVELLVQAQKEEHGADAQPPQGQAAPIPGCRMRVHGQRARVGAVGPVGAPAEHRACQVGGKSHPAQYGGVAGVEHEVGVVVVHACEWVGRRPALPEACQSAQAE